MAQQDVKVIADPHREATIYFHVNRRMSTEIFSGSHMVIGRTGFVEKYPRTVELLTNILAIPGVQDAWIDRYKVRVERSLAIDWPDIQEAVEGVIIAAVADGDLA